MTKRMKYRALKDVQITVRYADDEGIDYFTSFINDYDEQIVITENGWRLVLELHGVKGKKKQLITTAIIVPAFKAQRVNK
jgi:hypothetical protein